MSSQSTAYERRESYARKAFDHYIKALGPAFEMSRWESLAPFQQDAWRALAEKHLWELAQQLVEIRHFPCCTIGCQNDAILCSRRCGL